MEDVVRHGMTDEPTEIEHWDVDFLGEIYVGDGAGEGDCFSDSEFVHGLKRETVYRLGWSTYCFEGLMSCLHPRPDIAVLLWDQEQHRGVPSSLL